MTRMEMTCHLDLHHPHHRHLLLTKMGNHCHFSLTGIVRSLGWQTFFLSIIRCQGLKLMNWHWQCLHGIATDAEKLPQPGLPCMETLFLPLPWPGNFQVPFLLTRTALFSFSLAEMDLVVALPQCLGSGKTGDVCTLLSGCSEYFLHPCTNHILPFYSIVTSLTSVPPVTLLDLIWSLS